MPDELLCIDIKKLGRFDQVGHRITGECRQRSRRSGWEYLFLVIDDHSRAAFTRHYPDERRQSVIDFLRTAHDHFKTLGVSIQRLLTDNGPAFRSRDFGDVCGELAIKQKFTHADRPQTNGKAERFILSALREWAYGQPNQNSDQRGATPVHWNHYYNWCRPHNGIGCQIPMFRLSTTESNALTLHC